MVHAANPNKRVAASLRRWMGGSPFVPTLTEVANKSWLLEPPHRGGGSPFGGWRGGSPSVLFFFYYFFFLFSF